MKHMGEVTADRASRFLGLVSAEREAKTLDEICQRLATPEEMSDGSQGPPVSLMGICRAWDVPYARVLGWLMEDLQRFSRYKRALEIAAHALVAETVPIADGPGFPQEKRLRIETRFKNARFHAPETYAERVEVEHSGQVTFSHALQQIAERRAKTLTAREIDITPLDPPSPECPI